MADNAEDFLEHFGVKGMKWGRRKADHSSGDSGGGKSDLPPKRSRKELRRINKEGQLQFDQAKAHRVMTEAFKKGDNVLIKVHNQEPYPQVVTGREFANYLERGGVFNVKYTDVYATMNKKSGNFELNANMNRDRYQKVKR